MVQDQGGRPHEGPDASPVRVLVVDDNQMLCEALRAWSQGPRGWRMVASCPGHRGVLDAVIRERPDVVLMDFDIPGVDVPALIEDVGHANAGTRVLMLSGYVEGESILQCLEAGARGYISKDHQTEVIDDAIMRVSRGQVVLCSQSLTALHSLH